MSNTHLLFLGQRFIKIMKLQRTYKGAHHKSSEMLVPTHDLRGH